MPVKKISNIKSGQRVYRVWGYPVRPENKGEIASNSCKYSIRVEACIPKGKGNHRYSCSKKIEHCISGSVQNRYFHKKARAEQYKQEILQGLHPHALVEMEEHSASCDVHNSYLLNNKAWNDIDDYPDGQY